MWVVLPTGLLEKISTCDVPLAASCPRAQAAVLRSPSRPTTLSGVKSAATEFCTRSAPSRVSNDMQCPPYLRSS
eukprot:COSAG01_NODE_1685_length_9495_cov_61.609728_13_plen_74_part_00